MRSLLGAFAAIMLLAIMGDGLTPPSKAESRVLVDFYDRLGKKITFDRVATGVWSVVGVTNQVFDLRHPDELEGGIRFILSQTFIHTGEDVEGTEIWYRGHLWSPDELARKVQSGDIMVPNVAEAMN